MSEIKPHYSESRSILADVIPLAMPYSVQCEVSQICNIRCNYCMQSLIPNHGIKMMDELTFSILIGRILEFGGKLKQFNFAGWGEPLVNKKIVRMIRLLRSFNIVDNIAIITNGLKLTPELSLELIDAGVDHIRISLQGMSGSKYKEICDRMIDFDILVKNIGHLYKYKSQCQVSVKIADIALDPGQDQLFYDTFRDITDRMYIEHIRPMFKEDGQDDKLVSKYGIAHPPVIACPLPFYMLSVTATGDILPCCAYERPCDLGNISNTSLKAVWEGERLKWLREMMLDGNRKEQELYPVCKGCLMPDAILTPGDSLDERREEIKERLCIAGNAVKNL